MTHRHAPRAGSPTRDDVLEAAAALLRDGGPSALSVRRVADRVGVSRQVVYSRFGDKAGLVRALHDRGFAQLTAAVEAVEETVGTDEHIVGLAHAYRRSAVASPELFDIMFGRPIPEFVHDREARGVARVSFELIVEAARTWLQRNDGRPGDDRSLATSLWATTHGVVSLERVGHLTAAEAREQLDRAIRRLLRGSGRAARRA